MPDKLNTSQRTEIGSERVMTGGGEPSERELLRRISDGDEEAFRFIYERWQGPIYRFALHMTGSTFIAEDVTQEAFMKLIQGDLGFDPTRGGLSGYLFGIGRKILLRRLETEKAFVSFAAPDEHEQQDGHGAQNGAHPELVTMPIDPTRGERIGRVRQAVFSLPPNYREVVALCDLQEMSYQEAAGILECAVGTVRSRLHRARLLLMEKLREFHDPGHKVAAGGKP